MGHPVRGSSEKQIPFGDDNKKGKNRKKGNSKDKIPLSGAEEFVGGDGVGADADAGGVVDGVGDGGWHAGDADLADAAGAEWIELRVRDIEDGDVKSADVGVDGDVIVGEVAVGGAAGDRVDKGLFGEGEADAPDDAALELIDSGLAVHERADVVGGDDAADLDHARVAIDGDLSEDGAEGLRGVFVAVCGGLGGAEGFDGISFGLIAVAGHEGDEGFAA